MFWDDLIQRGKPIIGLSPMDGVTDAAMRHMSAKYGGPDIMFTEFVSVDALHFASSERRERLLKTFIKSRDVEDALRVSPSKSERLTLRGRPFKWPYEIAQVFGHIPEYFAAAAQLVEKLGFDGIDINMGCPAHKVEEQGSGAGLIRTPELAQEIIKTVKANTKLPVSVKTRIGVGADVAEEWMAALMEARPAMISLHGRTLKQLYQGASNWEAIARAAAVVHKAGGHILGNGDIHSLADGQDKALQYGVDGFLIGRAAEGNPGIFLQSTEPCNKEQQLAWMVEHAKVYEQVFGTGHFMPMRKHLAWYCKGFPWAVELRSRLVLANSADEVREIVMKEFK